MNNINAVFRSVRIPNCDTFFIRTFNLERRLTTCSERLKDVYPRNVYQGRETLFDKLDSFGIKYTSDQNVSKICVQQETLIDTNTTTWVEKHVPISVSISSNQVEEPILSLQICSSSPRCIFYWSSRKFSFPKQSDNETLIP